MSEWTKFFDEGAGRHRFKHKGAGVVRDTLMSIGKTFAQTATQYLKKAVENAAAQAAEKVATQAVEKGGEKIQQLLRARSLGKAGRNPPPDAILKLNRILANRL